MYFKLNPEVIDVIGNNGMLLHDTIGGRVFDFNNENAKVVLKLNEGFRIEDLRLKYNNIDEVIDFLTEKKLGKYYSQNEQIEKIKTQHKFILDNSIVSRFNLHSANIELTGKCNLDCIFCTDEVQIYRSCGCKKWKGTNSLTAEEYIHIIKDLINLGAKQITFSGGEPLLEWEVLKKLLELTSKKGINSCIYTNGILLDEEKAMIIKNCECSLNFQLVGYSEVMYNEITKVENSFQKVLEAIQVIEKYKIPTNYLFVENSINEDTYAEAQAYFSGKDLLRKIIFPPNKYSVKNITREKLNSNIPRNKITLNNYQYLEKNNLCLYKHIFISKEGYVYPCMMLRDFKLGDLKDEKISSIFLKKEYDEFWKLSKSTIEKCDICKRRLLCSDCRAIEYYATNDVRGLKYCRYK